MAPHIAPHEATGEEAAPRLGRELGLRLAAFEAASAGAPTEEQVRLFFIPQYWRLAHPKGADDRGAFERAFLEGYRVGAQRAG